MKLLIQSFRFGEHKREEENFTAADLPPWWAVLVTATM